MPAEPQMKRSSENSHLPTHDMADNAKPLPSLGEKAQLLVLASEEHTREGIFGVLGDAEYDLRLGDMQDPMAQLRPGGINVVLLYLGVPFEPGLELVTRIKGAWPAAEVILFSPHASDQLWIESIHRGAYDLLAMPLVKSELVRVVNNAIARHRYSLNGIKYERGATTAAQ